MKIFCTLVSLVVALIPVRTHAQTDDELADEWRAGHYEQVLPRLIERWQQPSGQSWQIEFMIGTSECRIEQLRTSGAQVLQDLLDRGDAVLPDEARPTISSEIDACRRGIARGQVRPLLSVAPVRTHIAEAARSGVTGKLPVPASSWVSRWRDALLDRLWHRRPKRPAVAQHPAPSGVVPRAPGDPHDAVEADCAGGFAGRSTASCPGSPADGLSSLPAQRIPDLPNNDFPPGNPAEDFPYISPGNAISHRSTIPPGE